MKIKIIQILIFTLFFQVANSQSQYTISVPGDCSQFVEIEKESSTTGFFFIK